MKRHIDALRYVGGKEVSEFIVLPLEIDDAERKVTFTKGEVKYGNIDLKPETIGFLKRDYRKAFEFFQDEIEVEKLFSIHVEKMIRDYGIKETAVNNVIKTIFKKIDNETGTEKRRGRPKANKFVDASNTQDIKN